MQVMARTKAVKMDNRNLALSLIALHLEQQRK